MILYRILTEDKNRGDIIDYVSSWFDGFTTYNGVGYWRGQAESCLVIEIISNDAAEKTTVLQLASWIKTHNQQDSVAVTEEQVKVYTVGEQL